MTAFDMYLFICLCRFSFILPYLCDRHTNYKSKLGKLCSLEFCKESKVCLSRSRHKLRVRSSCSRNCALKLEFQFVSLKRTEENAYSYVSFIYYFLSIFWKSQTRADGFQ